KEPRYQSVDSLKATQAEVVLPLKVESRIFGVLDIQANMKNAFDSEDILILRALADNIAIAIDSTRLYQGVQRQAEQLSAVSDVSRAITQILNTDELLQKIVTLIHDRFKFPFVHLYIIDPVNQQITFKAGSGSRTRFYEEAGISFNIHSDKGIISWVAQHGKTKRVGDVAKEPLFLQSPIVPEIEGSEMVVPLAFGHQILGVLDLQSPEKHAFSEEDQQLIETLGDNLAIAIRNARLYRSEKWRRQVAESLRDVAGLLSDNIALDEVHAAILEKLHTSLPCDVACIWLFNNHQSTDEKSPEGHRLHLAAYKTSAPIHDDALSGLIIAPDKWVQAAFQTKEPLIRQPDEPLGPIAERLNFSLDYSAIITPLVTGDEVIGLLTMIHHTPGRYGSESQMITSAFASYAAIAIQNNRLYAKSQEQAWISTILLQVANAIQSLTNLDELTATITRLTPMVVGVTGCALLLRYPDSKIFQLTAMYGMIDPSEEVKFDLPLSMISPPALEMLIAEQSPVFVHDPQEELGLPEDVANQLAKHSLILLPLTARNEVLGAFLLADEPEPDQTERPLKVFSEERYNIVQGIMQQTAVAIENIRLIEARQEEAYISAVLLQAAQAIVSSLNLQDTLDAMVNIMPILIGVDSSLIYLWDQNEERFVTAHATTRSPVEAEELLGTSYEPGEFPMLDGVFRNRRPIVYPFIENTFSPEDWDLALPDEGQIDPTPILQTHYPLLMGFPLSVKDEIYGVLLAQDENFATNRERRFELLWGIAQQASLAIQNDRLNKEMLDRQRLEREFQLAREIQQTFLPNEIPTLPGYKMDVRWETARQVGGDFYDFFTLPDERLAIVIADVSDKGLAASLYMAVTRTLLRAAALESDSPAKTLEHVNDLLMDNSQNGLFVTTFYGILSLEDGRLSYTVAGHNPPMVIRQDQNDVIALKKGGIALGAMPDIQLPEHKTILNPEDCLVLYTDGVTEAFNLNDQMYGEERFVEVLRSVIGNDATRVLEALEDDLADFRDGAPPSDDTTLLAICRGPLLGDNHGNPGAA
ncbi:MAG: GAF domain-containing protein, partial [Brevefilum sp.]